MTIDTKRLAIDADYWNELGAPEWADKVGVAYTEGEYWSHEFLSKTKAMIAPCNAEVRFIPRPTKPAEVEWDGPNDGELCVVWDDQCNQGVYFLCEYQEDGPRFQEHPKGGCFYLNEISWFKKTGIVIRTPEQRQREELASLILSESANSKYWCQGLAEVILQKYNLEPK